MARELDLGTARELSGIKQQAMADTLKISRYTLSFWELGRRSIPLEYAVQIAQILTEKTPKDPVTTDDVYAFWQISKERYGQTPKKPRRNKQQDLSPPLLFADAA